MIEHTAHIVAQSVLDAFTHPVNVSGENAVLLLREALKSDSRKEITEKLSGYLHAASAHPTHAGALISILLDDVLSEKKPLDGIRAEYLLNEITKQNGDGRTPLHIAATIWECPDEAAVKDRFDACKKLLDVIELTDVTKRRSGVDGQACQLVYELYRKSSPECKFKFDQLTETPVVEVSASYKDGMGETKNVPELKFLDTTQAQGVIKYLKSLGAIDLEPKNEFLITKDVYEKAIQGLNRISKSTVLQHELERQSYDGRTVLAHAVDIDYIDEVKGISLGDEKGGEVGEAVKLATMLVKKGANINATSGRNRNVTICEALAQTTSDNATLMLIALIRAARQSMKETQHGN